MKQSQKLARVFKALSVDTRIRIVQLLKGRNLCVNALASRLGISAAAVSQHLRAMRDLDLVEANKDGYYVHYRLNPRTLATWREMAESVLKADHE
ncbi:MAG: metalloregulator ArsR/SmtB family transcription factor [Candidatus Sumerlaeota bacterium]|nr:metalloregulator ArsR/SmtB family transcription factor [Candidatus Sumerlaeota bacterium]